MQNLGITVNELYEYCKLAIKDGYGDKHIQISSDDECNSLHSLFSGFISDKESLQYYIDEGMMPRGINNANEIIVLG